MLIFSKFTVGLEHFHSLPKTSLRKAVHTLQDVLFSQDFLLLWAMIVFSRTQRFKPGSLIFTTTATPSGKKRQIMASRHPSRALNSWLTCWPWSYLRAHVSTQPSTSLRWTHLVFPRVLLPSCDSPLQRKKANWAWKIWWKVSLPSTRQVSL